MLYASDIEKLQTKTTSEINQTTDSSKHFKDYFMLLGSLTVKNAILILKNCINHRHPYFPLFDKIPPIAVHCSPIIANIGNHSGRGQIIPWRAFMA